MISNRHEHRDEFDGKMYYATFHHNGDYSGNVIINLERAGDTTDNHYSIEIPMSLLKEFMSDYVRSKRIEKLEKSLPDELLS